MTGDLEQLCRFKVEGVEESFAVSSLDWRAGICRSDEMTIEVVPRKRRDRAALANEMAAKLATLVWNTESAERTLHLVVIEVHTIPGGLAVRLGSHDSVLQERIDYRVFVDSTVIDAAIEVLGDRQITVDNRCKATYPVRPQIVQHFETDLGFVTRILAEEGIAWQPDLDQSHRVAFIDEAMSFPKLEADPFTLIDESAQSQIDPVPTLFATEVHWRETTDRVTLRDYNFEKPLADITTEARAGQEKLENYEYRGPYTEPNEGKRLARLRLEGLRRDRAVLTGNSLYRGLRPGYGIELGSKPAKQAALDWLVTEVHTRVFPRKAASKFAYLISIQAIPAQTEYRPERVVPTNTLGVETVTVTGQPGDEIYTEEHARLKGQFRWDRRRPKDHTSSAWWRAVQPPNSGAVLLPRMHWEELTGFWADSADDPLMLGRLYEAKAEPPSSLPGNKTASAFGTLTTPGGGTANLVAFDDAAGNESMTFNASYDFNERTEKDKVSAITVDETNTIGVNCEVIVGQVQEVIVTGSQSWTIGASHDLSIKSNYAIETGTEAIIVGGARIFNVAGDQFTQAALLARVVGGAKVALAIEQESIIVKAASVRTYRGTWAQISAKGVGVTVGGLHGAQVNGLRSVQCKAFKITGSSLKETDASRSEKAGGKWTWEGKGGVKHDVSGAYQMKGSDVVFEAKNKIEIKAGGVKIVITPSKVLIKGKFNSSQSSADSASESYD